MNPLVERRAELVALTRRRLLATPVVLLAVTAATFFLASCSPLDPLAARLGDGYEHLAAADRDNARTALGLDRHWWAAWWHWLTGLVRGDAGWSDTFREPVADVVAQRLPWTLGLSAAGLLLAVAACATAGHAAARHPGGLVDRALAATALALSAIPTFVVALALIGVLAVGAHLLPVAGATDPGTDSGVARHLVLPALTLASSQLPWLVLTTRRAVLDAGAGTAVAHARARGLDERTVRRGHVLPVAVAPTIALLGARLPELVVGAVVVEACFGWPGLAAATVDAALTADFAMLAAVTALTTLAVLASTWVADCALLLADPRVTADV